MVSKPDASDLVQLLGKTASSVTRSVYAEGDVIFAQGDVADAIFYLEGGTIKYTILSRRGKQGVVAILKAGQFLGEGCIVGRTERPMTATAMTSCSVTRIEKPVMVRLLYEQPDLAEKFITFLIDQALQYQGELVDHLFNTAEKRLARTLLHLSEVDEEDGAEAVIPKISQETLAEIVGTTRSRINQFMNKFRGLGLIDYNGTIRVRRALISRILQGEDDPAIGETRPTILIVEDDAASAYALWRHLAKHGYRAISVSSSMAALKEVETKKISLVITDIRLSKGEPNGLALARMIRAKTPKIPTILVTAYPELLEGEQDLPGLVFRKPIEMPNLRRELAWGICTEG